MTAALKVGTPENKQLHELVDRCHQLKHEIKDKQTELKRLQSSAWEKFEVDKAVVAQMVTEMDWDDKKRAKRKVFEEGCADVRHALGLQLDMELKGGKAKKKSKSATKKPQASKARGGNKAKEMVDKAKADAAKAEQPSLVN